MSVLAHLFIVLFEPLELYVYIGITLSLTRIYHRKTAISICNFVQNEQILLVQNTESLSGTHFSVDGGSWGLV